MNTICYALLVVRKLTSNQGEQLVNRIKLARVAKGLNQQELAEKVDVTRQTIGLIESGNYNPTLKLCLKIAKALDKKLDDLFWESDDE